MSTHTPQTRAGKPAERFKAYRRIGVIGLGYVGLPTAMMFARQGFSVHGVDISPHALAVVNEGRVAEAYPELTDWWQDIAQPSEPDIVGGFTASSEPNACDVFLITVPTPVDETSKFCDLTAVRAAAESVARVLKPGNLVILESTVPPGTTRKVVKPILEGATGLKAGADFHLCFSPERILPGNTAYELVNNHRVLGSEHPDSAMLAHAILQQVIAGDIYLTDDLTAEFCKLAENTYRDVNIALANELSILADDYGIEMNEAQRLINMHPRVNLLKPGIGVGGHCIAVDPWFFVEAHPEKTALIGTSRRVNDKMPAYCAGKIQAEVADLENPRICAVGLTYKPDVADMRESPAVRLVELLKEAGMNVVTYDPLLPEYANTSLTEAVSGADYLAVLVNHTTINEQLLLNRETIKGLMRTPRIRVF
ncbi:MAG: nucleotide sugar dehydrogenase [Candidatus Melainabacteria bacterium]